jgi:hypothetical protein
VDPDPYDFWANNTCQHCLHLLCLHLCVHPLEQNLLLALDAIINQPVVEVERTRDEGG